MDTEIFYPAKGKGSKQAKETCFECPVREECLSYALKNNERFGVWGGMTTPERDRVRRAVS